MARLCDSSTRGTVNFYVILRRQAIAKRNINLHFTGFPAIVTTKTEFALTTTWSIPEPLDIVWFHLVDTEKWPQWWRYVATVKEIAAGDANGIGNTREYLWRTCLPYRLLLTLRVLEVKPYRYLAVEVSGDLQGNGLCDIAWNAAKASTEINFKWLVNPNKPWMIRSAPVLKPLFTWNHNQVMKNGEKGLIRYLSSLQHLL